MKNEIEQIRENFEYGKIRHIRQLSDGIYLIKYTNKNWKYMPKGITLYAIAESENIMPWSNESAERLILKFYEWKFN